MLLDNELWNTETAALDLAPRTFPQRRSNERSRRYVNAAEGALLEIDNQNLRIDTSDEIVRQL